jgi:hypothetical protein
MITEEIRQKYPFEQEYEMLENFCVDYESRRIKIIVQQHSKGKRMLGQNGILYLARISHRSNFLFSGFIDNISKKNSAVLFLILRAHIETTASLGYFLYNLKKYYEGTLSFNDINHILYRLSCGSKDIDYRKGKPAIPEAVNVLTMIDSSDKLIPSEIEETTKDDKPFSKIYTDLSECCHPNSLGLLYGVVVAKGEQFHFSEKPSLGTTEQFYFLIENMILDCYLFFKFYDKCFAFLKKNENMPKITI